MPTGHVKVFDRRRQYGFLTADDGGELFVHADSVDGGRLSSGDQVEFEVSDGNGRPVATAVKVVKPAPADNPAGRTLAAPPDWAELEERDRQRRQNRRRRR